MALRLLILCILTGALALPGGVLAETPGAGGSLLWVAPGAARSAPDAEIVIDAEDTYRLDSPVVFRGRVTARSIYETGQLRFEVLDDAGRTIEEGRLWLELREGRSPFRFRWDARELPEGVYTARLTFRLFPGKFGGWSELALYHFSADGLAAVANETAAAADEFVERLRGRRHSAPYAWMRASLAQDAASLAEQRVQADDHIHAAYLTDYARRAIRGAGAMLVFSSHSPELFEPVPSAPESRISARGGGFYADDRPVFLAGVSGGTELAEYIPRLARYGLNHGVFTLEPGDSLSAERRSLVRALIEDSRRAGIQASIRLPALDPGAQPALAAWNDSDSDSAFFDFDNVRSHLGEWSFLARPARDDDILSIILDYTPPHAPVTERLRDGFLDYIKTVYDDRHEMNWAWQTRHAAFEDVELDWDSEQTVYQYDLQSFYQQRIYDILARLEPEARDQFPGATLQLKLPANAFEEGEARSGVERESLSTLFDAVAVQLSDEPEDPYFSKAFPRNAAVYTLFRSFAPDRPLVNAAHEFLDPEAPLRDPQVKDYAHTVLWEAAMHGLSGSAAAIWAPSDPAAFTGYGLRDRPDAVEGYATAALDLNRLAPVVRAFQQAPAEVGILWSMPSKMYDDGAPFLDSALEAFEGAAFSGYNVRFVSERQAVLGALDDFSVFVIPDVLAVSNEAFEAIEEYVAGGGMLIRAGTLIPFDARGQSRTDVITATRNTMVLRGHDKSTNYLHAVDSAYAVGRLPAIPRAINRYGYPLEGVRTRYVEHDGARYLYIVNLRKDAVVSHLYGALQGGRDLIRGRDVNFPVTLQPLDPMLIRLDRTIRHDTDDMEDLWEQEPALVGRPMQDGAAAWDDTPTAEIGPRSSDD